MALDADADDDPDADPAADLTADVDVGVNASTATTTTTTTSFMRDLLELCGFVSGLIWPQQQKQHRQQPQRVFCDFGDRQ